MPGGIIEIAENPRKTYRIRRREEQEQAVCFQNRAVGVHQAAYFVDELAPVTVAGKRCNPDTIVDRYDHRRPTVDTSLVPLPTIRARRQPDSNFTVHNPIWQNDGARCINIRAGAQTPNLASFFGATLMRGHPLRASNHENRLGRRQHRSSAVGPAEPRRRRRERAQPNVRRPNRHLAGVGTRPARVLAGFKRLPCSTGTPGHCHGGRINAAAYEYETRLPAVYCIVEPKCFGEGQGLAPVCESPR